MPCALSRNARMLMVRCLAGEEIELTGRVILARRELERAGLLEEDSKPYHMAWMDRIGKLPSRTLNRAAGVAMLAGLFALGVGGMGV